MRVVVCACLIWLSAVAGWATEASVSRLNDALRLDEVVAILRGEGIEYGQILNEDMLDGAGGSYFTDQLAVIYDAGTMTRRITQAMERHLSPGALAESVAFFESETGQRIIRLEISARIAIADEDVERMAVERFTTLPGDDPQRRLIRDYVEANDLIRRNVDSTQASDFSFYRGLVDGKAVDRDDEGYLAAMLEERDELMADTEEWAMSFHLMAYHPLSVDEQQANIDFSRSAAGQEFNDALFAGFDGLYEDIFYQLGRLVARSMVATDL